MSNAKINLEIKELSLKNGKYTVSVEVNPEHNDLNGYELMKLYKKEMLKEISKTIDVHIYYNNTETIWRLEDGS